MFVFNIAFEIGHIVIIHFNPWKWKCFPLIYLVGRYYICVWCKGVPIYIYILIYWETK